MSQPLPPVRSTKAAAFSKALAAQGIVLPKVSPGALFLGVIVVYLALCLQVVIRM